MRGAGFAHPVRDDHGSNQFLHSNASVFRHLSKLGVYFRVQRLHELSCRYSSTYPLACYLGYNPVEYSRIRFLLSPSIVAQTKNAAVCPLATAPSTTSRGPPRCCPFRSC